MKKRFIFIVGFLLCNFCFGSIVIQNEALFGVKSTHYENCFDISDSEKNTIGFTFGALTNCMWEFGTKNTEIPFHFMTGVCVGMMENSFSFGVPIVFEFSVAKFDKLPTFKGESKDFERVEIALRQHIGAPSVAIIKEGAKVNSGDLIADSANGLSIPGHASITGVVTVVDGEKIRIDRVNNNV